MKLSFKIATENFEFEQIHRLNYKTFVEEIPQHSVDESGSLVDKFHSENTYLIGLDKKKVVGMMAIRDRRPFSLDKKLDNLDDYLPPYQHLCEFRLLAIEKEYRRSRVFQGIMRLLTEYCFEKGYDLGIMSGTLRQVRLYKQIGLKPFGPLVGTDDAPYQPMYMTLKAYNKLAKKKRTFSTSEKFVHDISTTANRPIVNLLPGPTKLAQSVQKTIGELPVSHRSQSFMDRFEQTRSLLREFVGAKSVELFMSSGTMANDVIAGQLSLLDQPGIVLSNGEFGDRLIDHASRAGLNFIVYRTEWGSSFDFEKLAETLKAKSELAWIWSTHCETSTGILNDLSALKSIASDHHLKLCLDCTSSLGTIELDLSEVYLASSVSGKGLGSLAGVSMVFYNHQPAVAPEDLPRYLDLGFYASKNGVPFTISSNLVYPLHTKLSGWKEGRFEHLKSLGQWLRTEVRALGLDVVGEDADCTPAVITIQIPSHLSSEYLGDKLAESGFLVSYLSSYLLDRNWIQICLMGECQKEEIEGILQYLNPKSWSQKVKQKAKTSAPSIS